MKRAILYVPGSTQHFLGQSASLVADRIARSLADQSAEADPPQYRIVSSADVHSLGPDISLDLASIELRSGDDWEPAIDIFELKYLSRFVKPFAEQPAIVRAVRATVLAAANYPRAQQALFRKDTPKNRLDKLQATFLGLIVLVAIVSLLYWILLAAAALLGTSEFLLNSGDNGPTSESFVIIATLVAVMTMGRLTLKGLVENMEKSAIEFYSMMSYIQNDRPYAAVTNAVLDALAHVQEKGYAAVDLMSFSLGCLVTADSIYPRHDRLKSGALSVRDWITIGHPYDLVTSTYPDYFLKRHEPTVSYARWINVAAYDDFLGSNFRYDDERMQPDGKLGIRTIDEKDVIHAPDLNLFFEPSRAWHPQSRMDVIPFWRIVNHSLYWDDKDARSPTCFGMIATEAGWDDCFTSDGDPVTESARASASG